VNKREASERRIFAVTLMVAGVLFASLIARWLSIPPLAVVLLAFLIGVLIYPRRKGSPEGTPPGP